jgi:hypothetical protein
MAQRSHCPSCHHRTTPLALECPVCGLTLPRQSLPRPLLFQASALLAGAPAKEERVTLSAPALGRVEPLLTLLEPVEPLAEPTAESPYGMEPVALAAVQEQEDGGSQDSFWPVVKMEALEFLLLACLNGFLLLVACASVAVGPSTLYGQHWIYLLPVHAAISWAYVMVPMVLVGQSPMMGRERLLLDTDLPERRMSFSLLHLFSTACFPLSFLCMVLTRNHRTLAELLSGQEILQMAMNRNR